MTNKIIIIVLMTVLTISNNIFGQGFKAMAILGTNAAQIDGDNLYGFKKIGISGGGRISYTNLKSVDYSLEMLYSQRGSAINFFNNRPDEKINLNYLEIPVIVSIRDWFQEKDKYYKVRVEGGLSYGYLFGAEATGFDVSFLRKSDISWLLAAGINFNKIVGISIRYTSSFLDLYNDEKDEISFKSYFLTFRTELNF